MKKILTTAILAGILATGFTGCAHKYNETAEKYNEFSKRYDVKPLKIEDKTVLDNLTEHNQASMFYTEDFIEINFKDEDLTETIADDILYQFLTEDKNAEYIKRMASRRGIQEAKTWRFFISRITNNNGTIDLLDSQTKTKDVYYHTENKNKGVVIAWKDITSYKNDPKGEHNYFNISFKSVYENNTLKGYKVYIGADCDKKMCYVNRKDVEESFTSTSSFLDFLSTYKYLKTAIKNINFSEL